MDDTPLYKRPWFYIAAWVAVLLVVYGWQIARMGGFVASEVDIFIDLACLFPLLLVLWMAFFSQFVLPVQTLDDRLKIFSRLVSRLFGSSGPAIFIRNGVEIKREGEDEKVGPGVLWLDSASAAVTRTPVKVKQTIGPGVHFTDTRESIAGTLDLHIQSHELGPRGSDKSFAEKSEDQTDEEYHQIQDRRKQVSALTRDGIEVVPNISVSFRVNTGFPAEGKPGSRFGYRTGTTPRDQQNEKEDKDAIYKAIMGEAINPNVSVESPRHRVAWNQLPASLVVDVWREYVSKFTFDELFDETQEWIPSQPPPPQPTEEEVDPLSQPLQVSATRNTMSDSATSMLRRINLFMSDAAKRLEGKNGHSAHLIQQPAHIPQNPTKTTPQTKTAYQVIGEMVQARLTQPEVDFLNDTGKQDKSHQPVPSREFQLLRAHGLKVLSVGIGYPRFDPTIDEEKHSQWEADWLTNANAEQDQIEHRHSLIKSAAQEQAMREYANLLSQAIIREKPVDLKSTLETLLMCSRTIIIRRNLVRRQMTEEQQELDNIIRWVGANENGTGNNGNGQ